MVIYIKLPELRWYRFQNENNLLKETKTLCSNYVVDNIVTDEEQRVMSNIYTLE